MFVSIYSWNYSSTTLRDMKFLKITNYGKGILWLEFCWVLMRIMMCVFVQKYLVHSYVVY